MAIRRKDGNLYVLEGPNPIVREQVSWDPNTLVFHNFSWEEIMFVQGSMKSTTERREIPKADNPPAQSDKSPESPPDINKMPEVLIEEPPRQEPKEFDLPYIKYKVLCYCLPAITKVHTDRLYGESWQRVTYGDKFVFPCVVMTSTDISLEFWTSDPRTQIEDKSIIYPFSYEVHNASSNSYDKVPYDEYRWWKVSRKEPKEGGWLFHCIPSQDQPDFSG